MRQKTEFGAPYLIILHHGRFPLVGGGGCFYAVIFRYRIFSYAHKTAQKRVKLQVKVGKASAGG